MALVPFATLEQLADWLDTDDKSTPDNAAGLLRSATVLVAEACDISPYTGPAGDGPLADATCAQVAFWVALGVDPNKGGTDLQGPVKKSSILGAAVERDTSTLSSLMTEAAKGLCGEAESILRQAGLLYLGDFQIADAACGVPEMTELGSYAWPALTEWPYTW